MNMWNLSIFDSNKQSPVLKYFYENALSEIERLGGTVELATEKNVIFLRVNEKHLAYMKAFVKQILAEAVADYFKPQFFEEKLHLLKRFNLNGAVLLKTICVLDKDLDIEEIKREMVIKDGEFHINSFWLFKLCALKMRWSEVATVISMNLTDIVATDSFLDIVKFLLKLVEKNYNNIKIVETPKEILFNENKQTIASIKLKPSQDLDNKVISKLIELSPAHVEWEGENLPKLKNLAMLIFN